MESGKRKVLHGDGPTDRNPAGVDVVVGSVGAAAVVNWNQSDAAVVIWQNVNKAILGAIAVEMRVVLTLITTDEFQFLYHHHHHHH